jgi:tryptophan synthase alpha chain
MPEVAETEGAARIARAFAAHGRRAALMPYLMGGFPDPDRATDVALACADAGADLVELGVPFSDPLADGPAIHAAATAALAAGATVGGVLETCEALSQRLPVALMVYVNTILSRGPEEFCALAREAGAAALIVPDAPHDESAALREACDRAGLALVPLVAPTTADDRLREIAAEARGFVYTVSLAGTTGERGELAPGLTATVARVREASRLPVAVGFGISAPDQASRVADLADGVIVGSRIVRAAGEGGPEAVHQVVSALGDAIR